MANTQINITENGTKTLATVGKYCDRNIDVNVNVPIPNGYIEPTGSKSITANGTHDVTSYASAVVNVPVPSGYINPSGSKTITTNGTHDVTQYANAVVDVPDKATQFTNVLEYAESLEVNKRISSNGSYNTSNPNSCIVVTLNLDKLPGGNPLKNNNNDVRFRGCIHIDASFAQSSDGVNYAAKGCSTAHTRIDEYGDLVYDRGYTAGPYVRFNIGLVPAFSSSNAALPADFDPVAAGCIVTFDQPIGNGGYVG